MTDKLHVGLIGCGRIAQSIHLQVLNSLNDVQLSNRTELFVYFAFYIVNRNEKRYSIGDALEVFSILTAQRLISSRHMC